MQMARPFLTARWEDLVLLNFECPAEILAPLCPVGTELDSWQGRHLVSLVGFHFVDTRLKGIPIPGHRNFAEVNLRFYVRRNVPDEAPRRGVVFVREVVPRHAISWTARLLYNEPYATAQMTRDVSLDPLSGGALRYGWAIDGERHELRAEVQGAAHTLVPGSEAEFITEHYWGYTRQRDGGTIEYRVSHPAWQVWEGQGEYESSPAAMLYGSAFSEVLSATPHSCFVAVGSGVEVFPGVRVADLGGAGVETPEAGFHNNPGR